MCDVPRHFVVAISGVPGAGKSSLIRELTQSASISTSVSYDDHPNATARSQGEIADWFARGADPNEFALSELVDALREATRLEPGAERGIVLFETPFGRLHRETARFIDLLVWLQTPLDVAFARQIRTYCAIAQNRSRSDHSGFVEWLSGYSAFYLASMRAAYLKQMKDIGADADQTLDGVKDIALLCAEVCERLKHIPAR